MNCLSQTLSLTIFQIISESHSITHRIHEPARTARSNIKRTHMTYHLTSFTCLAFNFICIFARPHAQHVFVNDCRQQLLHINTPFRNMTSHQRIHLFRHIIPTTEQTSTILHQISQLIFIALHCILILFHLLMFFHFLHLTSIAVCVVGLSPLLSRLSCPALAHIKLLHVVQHLPHTRWHHSLPRNIRLPPTRSTTKQIIPNTPRHKYPQTQYGVSLSTLQHLTVLHINLLALQPISIRKPRTQKHRDTEMMNIILLVPIVSRLWMTFTQHHHLVLLLLSNITIDVVINILNNFSRFFIHTFSRLHIHIVFIILILLFLHPHEHFLILFYDFEQTQPPQTFTTILVITNIRHNHKPISCSPHHTISHSHRQIVKHRTQQYFCKLM
eukprot:Pompholyxophrys_sp_v1_NODE_7_length_5994_cov_24.204748.p2 type:complete len:385 gc:universal NODE_7_length_5994_cov_24.204748:3039-4193(+)